jgi:hypothetical protein
MYSDIYIHHHMGMGDNITCNGLVRNITKQYKKVYLFYKSHPWHLPNLQYMYRDLGNKMSYIGGMDWHDEFVDFYIMTHPGINYMRIGFEYLTKSPLNFDQAFYEQAGVPFQKKFDDFYIQRDDAIEDEVCKKLNPTGEPYIFIHQDLNRGHKMNLDYIQDKKLKVIEPSMDYLFAHHAKLIENAVEIHVMESTFKCYIDCFLPEHDNMFFHKYMRPGVQATGRPYWKIID